MPFNIQKANQIHNNQYDYSRVIYVDVATKVEIVCPHHGPFWQSPKIHLYRKGGCRQCADSKTRGSFDVERARYIHGNKYDYSKVQYVNVDHKVEIICPAHGSFNTTPYCHINRRMGCPKCKGPAMSKARRMTRDAFIAKATAVHGDQYDYSGVEIVNCHVKVIIHCPLHGEFMQTPTNHIDNKNGCPQCGYNVSSTGRAWLDSVAPKHALREHVIQVGGRRYKVDGYDPTTNTIYEYFGVFWHGCPTYTDHASINPRNQVPFKVLYQKTLERIKTFESAGFNLVYEWGK